MDSMNDEDKLPGVDSAINKCHQHLLDKQYPEGYWWGELQSNPTIEAEYLLLTHFLGIANQNSQRKLTNHILREQRSDGTWGQFYGAPGDLSTSTECYFALKMGGVSPDQPAMRKAKAFILSKGGVPNTRVFTKIWLALFGQWDWQGVPVMPPEIMLLPTWSPINIYAFSSWARATIVPLLIILDRRPVQQIPESAKIDELFPLPRNQTSFSVPRPKRITGWSGVFYATDSILRQIEQYMPWKPARAQAIRRAERWVIDHQEADGSWGGIQPPWVYSLMALHSLGYPLHHPVMSKGISGFNKFSIEETDTMRLQASVSPVWDTGLTMISLIDSGMNPGHPALVKAGKWLLNEQVLKAGDWQVKAKNIPPGGWAFEFDNDLYPDLDDTAEIVMALDKASLSAQAEKDHAIGLAVRWLLGMQSRNGGWGAFDKNNTKAFISRIPFANFGETVDPPSVDVTSHILEMFGQLGYSTSHPAISKALDYVLSEQEQDGAWFGRWGVNYIYGTATVLSALDALGFDMSVSLVNRAIRWIIEHQNDDGGWGESCSSYVDPSFRGRGASTASQTAWALLSLLSANEESNPATEDGIEYLIRTQRDDGSWNELYFTGTGFPGYGTGQRRDRYVTPDEPGYQSANLSAGFMINYQMYSIYWPLLALGRYKSLLINSRA